jgi:chemotaxis protein methyltransferase CheR
MAIQTAHPSPTPIAISEGEYRKFCEFFYRATGISFGDNKRYFVDKRLIGRIEKTGQTNFTDYFDKLRRRDATPEIERLINLLTVNETYFYREDHQFECLVHAILPELTAKRRKGERIRIWSIPCSTGEEPYSIAMYLLENWAQVDDYDIEIIGSDIDTNALAAAEQGVYDKRALHRLSPDMTRRYFTPAGGDRFRLIEDVRGSVRFTQINVSDAAAMRGFAHLDIIFCRNMLIYFDDASRLKTVECFYDSLASGGFICLGHSESMSRISPLFQVRTFPQAIVYQKTGGSR